MRYPHTQAVRAHLATAFAPTCLRCAASDHPRAGVARFRAHDLRRTVVGDLLDAAVDLATVSPLCGHAGPATTARYGRRTEQAQHHAAGLLHVPFTPKPSSGDEPATGFSPA